MKREQIPVILQTAILLLCLAAQLCSAQTQSVATVDLRTLSAKYEQCMVDIQTNVDKSLQDWSQAYIVELKKMEQKFQGAGNQDGLQAVRSEVERFGNEKSIPQDAVVSAPAVLKDLQLKWQKMPENIEVEKSRKVLSLSRSYMAALEDLKKKLTIQGKLQLAIEVKKEADQVKTSLPVTASELVLANAEAASASGSGRKSNPAAETSGTRKTGPTPVGVWKCRKLQNAGKESSTLVELRPDGRLELKIRDKDWSGTYTFVDGSNTRMSRTCNNGETIAMEYDPVKDVIRQGNEILFFRVNRNKSGGVANRMVPVAGEWKFRWLKKGNLEDPSLVELHSDGRFEIRKVDKDGSGRYTFVDGSKTKIKWTCNNKETVMLEYDPVQDVIKQGEDLLFYRVGSSGN